MSKIDYSKYEGRTAGPWIADVTEPRARVILDRRTYDNEAIPVAVLGMSDRPAVQANAHLIADAPMLLERCKKLEESLAEVLDWAECYVPDQMPAASKEQQEDWRIEQTKARDLLYKNN